MCQVRGEGAGSREIWVGEGQLQKGDSLHILITYYSTIIKQPVF